MPISSWTGDCLVEASSREMGWYSGPSLMQALDALLPPARHVEQPLRLPISDVFKVRCRCCCRRRAGHAQSG